MRPGAKLVRQEAHLVAHSIFADELRQLGPKGLNKCISIKYPALLIEVDRHTLPALREHERAGCETLNTAKQNQYRYRNRSSSWFTSELSARARRQCNSAAAGWCKQRNASAALDAAMKSPEREVAVYDAIARTNCF